jgi:PKD repeat protein
MRNRKSLLQAIKPILEQLERRNLFAAPHADPGGPYSVDEGSSIVISGAASTGGGLTYQWDINYDGVTFHPLLSGSSFTFRPSDGNATRHMALKVTNVDGNEVTPFDVTITDVPTQISVSGSGSGVEGTPYSITWTSSDPGADTITSWRVNWGDGTPVDVLAANATGASHTFATDDTYAVVVSAVDEDGTHAAANHNVVITNVLPVVTVTGNNSVNEGANYQVDFSATDAGGTAVALWAIDWGDGSSDVFDGSASSATHAYEDNGNYTITATAVSEDGDSGSNTKAVTVNNVAPSPAIVGEPVGPITEGTAVNLTASRTDPGVNDTVTYAWVVTKNGQAYDSGVGANFSFTPDDDGSYIATVTATDNDGGETSISTADIIVGNANPTASIGGAPGGHVNEGDAVNLTASATDAGTDDTHTFAWTVTKNGDAYASGAGANFSFTPDDNGTYVVTLTATDDNEGTGTDTVTITADNVAPNGAAIAGAPANSNEGTAISLTGSASDAGSADTVSFSWAVTKDGNPYTTGSGSSFSFTPTDNGAYVVTLTATDDDGDTDTDTANITVDNVAPASVTITGAPANSPEGTQINLTGSASDVGSADTLTYAWAVTKDGNAFDSGAGASYSFTPDDNGSYVVTLTVTDDDGASTSTSETITVTNANPVPSINGAPVGSIAEGTAVNLSATFTDTGANDTVSYAWTVTKDGDAYDSGAGANFSFTPDDNGDYVVTVVATDNNGGTGSVSTDTITVTNANPTASIGGAPGGHVNEGDAVNLTASATDPGSADTHTYAWTVTKNGDAFDSGTGANFSFTPDDNGTYVVTVTATDDDGGTDTDSVTVTADNVAPNGAAITGAPANSNEGAAISLTGSASDAGSADTITYSWSVTKDGNPYTTGSGSSFSFTPTDNGAYVVTLTATDDDGDTDTDTANITVDNVAPASVTITGAPASSPEGTQIDLTASASDAGSADTLTYAWAVTKDGNAFDSGVGASYSFTPDDNGSYVVTLTATDDDGASTSTSQTITVTNVAPTPTIAGEPVGSIAEGTAVNLSVSRTDPGSNDTVTYAWTVTKNGDAFDSGVGANFSFTPDDDGTYVATVTAMDNDGGHSSVSTGDIVVTNANPTASIGGAPGGHVNEGDAVNLTASATDAGTADTQTYAWTVTKNGDDFASGTGANFSFTPDDNGTYVVTVTATDDDGGTDTDGVTLTADNVAPNGAAITGAPANSDEGTAINLSGNAADAGSADTITYTWTVTKNGNAYVSGSGSSFTFTPNDNGAYVVTLTATDDDGDTDTDTANITVDNVAPSSVTISGAPANSPEGTQIDVSGSASDAGSADTLTYAWSVTKDGNAFDSGAGANFSFVPDDNASYVVTLTATDDDGVSTSTSETITVTNANPAPTITGTPVGPIAEGTAVNLSASATDAGSNDTSTYGWVVTKDGDAFDSGTGANFSFTPTDNGTYVVTLTATDNDGGQASVSTDDIIVTNANPAASIGGAPGGHVNEGSAVNLTASATDAGTDDTHTFSWTVTKNGDAYSSGSGANFSFTPDDNGTYVVTLTATDDDGGTDTDGVTVTADNVAPTGAAISGAPVSSNEGTAINLTGSATDAGSGDTITYSWTVTKNGNAYASGAGSSFSFTPDDNGTYDVILTATDDDGGTDTDTASITVNNVAPSNVTISGAPDSSPEGTQINVTGSADDAGSADTLTYGWAVTKDGNAFANGAGSNFSFTPDDNASYVVTITATDDDGDSTSASHTITVTNANPAPSIAGAPVGTIAEGTAVNLSASATDAGSNDTSTYAWSVTKNGDAFDSGVGANYSFTPDDNGEYIVTLTATDNDGGSASTTATINVTNANPVASISGAPVGHVNEGDAVNLTAGATDDGSADTHTYAWAVTKNGDAYASGTGSSFSFTPDDNGSYVVTLTATDDDGGTDTDTVTVIADNVNPNATTIHGTPVGAIEGDEIDLSATSSDIGSADTVTYAWSVTKNGDAYADGSGVNFSFPTDDNGTYVVTLTATDDDGGTDTDTVTINVANFAPLVGITDAPTSSPEGTGITLGAEVIDPAVLDTSFTFAWSVTKNGNAYGVAGTNSSYSFTPNDNGTYVVTLTVTDKDGGATTDTRTITVTNATPVPSIGGTPGGSIDEGTALNFTSSVTDAGSLDTVSSYLWSVKKDGEDFTLPGGADVSSASFGFTPTDNGSYVVTLQVTDNDGATGSISTGAILVSNAAPTVSVSGEPVGSIAEGDTITLSGSASDAGALDTLTYEWSVTRNGSEYTLSVATDGTSLSFVPSDEGTYVVTLKVTDKDGTFTTASSSEISVTNANPAGSISGAPDSAVDEGSIISLGVSAADPGSADTLTYLWSVTKDGETFVLPGETNVTGTSFSFSPTDEGSYIVTVRVSDNDGGFVDVATNAITVNNVDPVGVLDGDTTGSEGSAVNFTASGTDAGADTLSFAWTVLKSVNTIATGTGAEFSFTPTDNGTYIVQLTVTDGDGGTNTVTRNISISNVAPIGTISGTLSGQVEGTAVTLTASGADPSSDDTAAVLALNWSVTKNGDGFAEGTGSTITFTPDDNGVYVVTLTTMDKDNDSHQTTATVTVGNVDPTATITGAPDDAVEGSSISLGSTVSDVGSLDTFTYAWSVLQNGQALSLGDVVNNEAGFAWTPANDGTYTVRLVVTDKDGGTVTTEQEIVVDNAAPTATLDGPEEVLRGTSASFTASFDDAGTNDSHTITWSFGDGATQVFSGTSASATAISHTYNTPGEYTVTYTVADADGGSVTESFDITVSAAMVDVDPNDPNKTALFVNGSNSADEIVLRATDGGAIEVLINGESQGIFTFDGGIHINSFGGDDDIRVGSGITTGAVIDAGTGHDTVAAGAGDDTIIGGLGDDSLRGGAGDDSIAGGSGADRILGGDGDDAIDGGTENDIIYGLAGADNLLGASGKDRIYGGDGDDLVNGQDGDDSLFGEAGKDKVYGENGADSLDGGAGADSIMGGAANDQLFGGTGADKLYGQAGDDLLTGGGDADRLDGGDGKDQGLKDSLDSYTRVESILKTLSKPKVGKKPKTAASLTIKK